MSALLAGTVDATLLLAGALLTVAALRRRSASVRHAVLVAGLVAAALAPLFEWLLPPLPLIRLPGAAPVVSSGLVLTSAQIELGSGPVGAADQQSGGLPWQAALLVLWATGGLLTSAALLTSVVRLSRLTRQCVPIAGGSWRRMADDLACAAGIRRPVQILQSPNPDLLVSTGVLRPRIILPAGADGWSDDRLRIVLAHELAHVRRCDGAILLAGEILRVVYWFNPLVWITCRRLRQESEYACDDAVLRGGVEATDYASHLLEIARQVARRERVWASAPGIAHPSTLERRIVAMLHRERNRAALPRRAWAMVVIVALAFGMPLAAIGVAPPDAGVSTTEGGSDVTLRAAAARASWTPSPAVTSDAAPEARPRAAAPAAAAVRQVTGTIGGTVLDQFGGTLPGARLTLAESQTALQLTLVTDPSGRFVFRDLLPGQYALVASLPGFASVNHVLALDWGDSIHRTIALPLGSIEETITVVCGSPLTDARPREAGARALVARAVSGMFPVVMAQGQVPMPVRVGGSVRPPTKLNDASPVCPPGVVPATEISVRLAGRVGADGLMHDVTHLVAPPGMESPAELTQAALDAVRQWTFTPTRLNGRAVDVNIAVHVLFRPPA